MSNTSSTAEHQVRRPGIKSSEFWLTIFAMAVSTVLPALSDAFAEHLKDTPHAAFAPVIAAAGYAIGRSIVKKSRNDASGAAAAIPNVAAGGDVHLETGTKPEFAETDESEGEPENPNIGVIQDAEN